MPKHNSLAGDSRVGDVVDWEGFDVFADEQWNNNGIALNSYSKFNGATFDSLRQKILNFDHVSSLSPNTSFHLYVFAGICDISTLRRDTHRPRDRSRWECYFNSENTHFESIQSDIQGLDSAITSRGMVPIYCTIPLINFSVYNDSLGNFSHRQFSQSEYNLMTAEALPLTLRVSDYLISLNQSRSKSTPLLHKSIIKSHGNKHKQRIVEHFEYFRDGLHASESFSFFDENTQTNKVRNLKRDWAESIFVAMKKNSQ